MILSTKSCRSRIYVWMTSVLLLSVAVAPSVLAPISFRMALRAGFAAVVAFVFFDGIFYVHDADTISTGTFLLGNIDH